MKSYITETQLRIVGKGWEIREQLRRMCGQDITPQSGTNASEITPKTLRGAPKSDGGQMKLAALLPQLIAVAEHGKRQPAPLRTQRQKMPDRRIIPFPSL